MLKLFFKCCKHRNFSTSKVWRNVAENKTPKPVENPTTKPVENQAPITHGVQMDFVPNEFDKFVLVFSRRYKSKDEIPPRISYSAIDNARSRVRIKLSNILMVGTVILFGYYIWNGKQRAKAGESINKIMMERDKQILENAAKEKALKGT